MSLKCKAVRLIELKGLIRLDLGCIHLWGGDLLHSMDTLLEHITQSEAWNLFVYFAEAIIN